MANPVMDQLIADVTRSKDAHEATLIYIAGVPGLIEAGVADAVAKGATEAQVEMLRSLEIKISADAVLAAINAGVPPANQLKKK